jgi:AraC-like DNA-binding protein
VRGRLTRLSSLDATRTDDEPVPRLKPRGLPPALAPHGVYAAANPAEASMYGRDLLGSHRVVVDDPGSARFNATYHGVLIRDVTLGYLDYGTAVTVHVHELGADTLVIVPANGEADVLNSGSRVDASPVMAAIPQPGTEMTLRCPQDTALLVVRIDRSALDLHLGRLLGRTVDRPVEFDLAFDLSTGAASRWNFAVQMLHAELFDDGSLLHRSVGLGQLEEFVMSSLLYSQPSNYSDLLASPSEQAVRRAVRLACDHIEHNLAGDLTVADIAAAAEVSVRTLQNQFVADLAQTPTAYLKNRRLERARADLADARPGRGATVTDIATRWGFRHLGRFSVTYRNRFGESPSQTLRS